MAGATPFPFELLSRTPCRANGEAQTGDDPNVACRSAGDHWTSLSTFGSIPEERCAPKCQHTADDLARAVDEARRETAIDVEARLRSEFETSLEQRRCDLLAAIRDQLQQQRSAFDDKLTDMAVVTQSLAVALANAVVPRAIEREPLADIADGLKATLARLVTEPSLDVRLPPDVLEAGTEVLKELAKEAGFEGGVMTTADPSLGKGDAVVSWKGGVAERRLDRLQADALELVDRWLPAQAEDPEVDDGSLISSAETVSDPQE